MPVQQLLTFKHGARSRIALVHLRDAADPARGATGLRHDTPGAAAGYARAGDREPRRIALAPARLGVHNPGGFVEVDRERLPGYYQLGLPDEALAAGSGRVLVLLHLPGAIAEPIEIDLVGYDPEDHATVGIGELGNKLRHRFLRAAMRDMTVDDFESGQPLEQELTARIESRRTR